MDRLDTAARAPAIAWYDDEEALAEAAARHVAALIARRPNAAIAFPTGATPLATYRRLAAMRADGAFDLSQARVFNLDEFAGKGPQDAQSYANFLGRHLTGPLALPADHVRFFNGAAPDPEAECAAVERAIEAAGGLDLAVLGLGRNGHVAFNEPGSAWDSPSRVVELAEETRAAQGPLYDDPTDVPKFGLTLGLAPLRRARSLLLLVSGRGKSAALDALARGEADPRWPVTSLLGHDNLAVLATRAAANA
ncbi:glucosamine-6-phosphate deaminase [Segnochrobactrum spirostomi]|uniref:Glucosamine-6-phosphate deaminase n=1 Tax=Segnochrobactrum spirostomi TaxID=2608987 RepID=A0A6A7YAX7_9HYPH|nr:glucosamine-6-phosphate deaminase [Segnochrobactrum spirostomi]MQT15487.1 glucosamine-6-phosphate deaminase [Segnochrobactrum spirostomi]